MRPLICLALALLLAACSASPAQPADKPAPRPSSAAAAAPVNLSCRTDADCTVKNVGNCCGAAPACVNVDSPTDPAAVMAQCQASGRMSVCGSPAITGCQCVQGQCSAAASSADTLRRPIEPTEPVR
ncbi:hypothetical protein P6166_13370 [Stenotrophomonas sp. HITSZ_GD]|uniref:hypothetical protein n=1 Tax=Stenotrophomonas sp. HITSZ_GD TaxID=3037248 RepID=UPI00240E7361|nr:hypothetical protein [Stenotrophomonas sp. HITSZ_GD]MDG2526345.1 hypothetical protein [Stenotrophomonas sp. HITSZ_GD]